jgi:hypothetical protein
MEQPSEHPDPARGLGLTDVGRELERMLRDAELERIARALERDIEISADDADDAVFTAVKATLEAAKPPKPQKVGSYVYTASKREAVRVSQAASRRFSLESAESIPETADFVEKIISDDVYAQIRARILGWDNAARAWWP